MVYLFYKHTAQKGDVLSVFVLMEGQRFCFPKVKAELSEKLTRRQIVQCSSCSKGFDVRCLCHIRHCRHARLICVAFSLILGKKAVTEIVVAAVLVEAYIADHRFFEKNGEEQPGLDKPICQCFDLRILRRKGDVIYTIFAFPKIKSDPLHIPPILGSQFSYR